MPTEVPYHSSGSWRITVLENMTSLIKLCLVLKPHHRVPSVMSVKISCRMNIWHVSIGTKHIKLKLDWIDIKLNVKKETNHLITNTIYHLPVMITIQHFPEQLITLGPERAIPFCQTQLTKYAIKLFSGIKIFSFYPHVSVGRDILKKQLGC